jgi:hypothetical protein
VTKNILFIIWFLIAWFWFILVSMFIMFCFMCTRLSASYISQRQKVEFTKAIKCIRLEDLFTADFAEQWHVETNNRNMSFSSISPLRDVFLTIPTSWPKLEVIDLMVELIGVELVEAGWEVTKIKEAHAQFTY